MAANVVGVIPSRSIIGHWIDRITFCKQIVDAISAFVMFKPRKKIDMKIFVLHNWTFVVMTRNNARSFHVRSIALVERTRRWETTAQGYARPLAKLSSNVECWILKSILGVGSKIWVLPCDGSAQIQDALVRAGGPGLWSHGAPEAGAGHGGRCPEARQVARTRTII